MTDSPRTAPDSAPKQPPEVDLSHPSAARAYDYYLGGNLNFAVDREFAGDVLDRAPFVTDFARSNRAFLHRAVTWLCARGVDQFLDIGSGLPTVGHVHEIAEKANPRARTVYVDYEPVAVARARTILDETDPGRRRTGVFQADLRAPDQVLGADLLRETLDFSRPVALLIVATMHFVGPGDGPETLLRRYWDALPGGSYAALSHLTRDGVPDPVREQGEALEQLYATTPNPGYFRDRAEFTALFGDLELVDPGVVWAPEWHPEAQPPAAASESATLVGVARKPAGGNP